MTTYTTLSESQLIGLANSAHLIEQIDPHFSAQSLADCADIARSGRRHHGILPSEAMSSCLRVVERYGLTWTRDRRALIFRARARPL